MTKKLEEMLANPKPKMSKVKVQKMTKKERLAVRGVSLHVGTRKTIDLMHEHIKEQRLTMPVVDLSLDDPAAQFAIQMYSCLGEWDAKHLAMFIEGVSGKTPEFNDTASMLGTVKSIFHAIFEDNTSKELVNRYDSVWKMWPNVRSKPSKKERSEEVMATKKASTKKTVGKKKAPSKKAAKNGGERLSKIVGDTKLLKKKKSCGESEAWDEVLNCMPEKAITFDALVSAVSKKLDGDEVYTRRVVGSLRRRSCIVAVE